MFSSATDTQIVNSGVKYINDLQISRTSNTALSIAPGLCRDSTNTFDIPVANALTLTASSLGVNGLDTGTFSASKMYNVYVIFDFTWTNPPASLLSLSTTAPVLPFGYSAFRRIGAWGSDASTHFYLGYYNGNESERNFFYDAILATPLTAGTQTSFTAVNLVNLVPALDNLIVSFYPNFTANAAADTAAFRPTGSSSTNGQHIMTASVAGSAAHTDQKVSLLTKLATGNPSIDYKVSAGSLALSIEGFTLHI